MAAPQVAGLVALYLQASPNSTPHATKAALMGITGDTIYTSSANNDWTDGRSLLGGDQTIMFNKFTSPSPSTLTNLPSGFLQNGIKITTK